MVFVGNSRVGKTHFSQFFYVRGKIETARKVLEFAQIFSTGMAFSEIKKMKPLSMSI